MTERELYLLLETSCVDLPPLPAQALPRPLCALLEEAGQETLARRCALSPQIRPLRVEEYLNDNPSPMSNTETLLKSGFVGYTLVSPGEDCILLFRASESETLSDLWTDWRSNVSASLGATIAQQERADAQLKRAGLRHRGRKLLLGHSKGGNLAAYAFVHNLALFPKAFIVNGQPLYWPGLTGAQKEAIRGVDMDFIVHEGDVISALGYVDYIRRIVALRPELRSGIVTSHALESAAFTPGGSLISLCEGTPGGRRITSALFYGLMQMLRASGIHENVLAAEELLILVYGVINIIACMARHSRTGARRAAGRCIKLLQERNVPQTVLLCAGEVLNTALQHCAQDEGCTPAAAAQIFSLLPLGTAAAEMSSLL